MFLAAARVITVLQIGMTPKVLKNFLILKANERRSIAVAVAATIAMEKIV